MPKPLRGDSDSAEGKKGGDDMKEVKNNFHKVQEIKKDKRLIEGAQEKIEKGYRRGGREEIIAVSKDDKAKYKEINWPKQACNFQHGLYYAKIIYFNHEVFHGFRSPAEKNYKTL